MGSRNEDKVNETAGTNHRDNVRNQISTKGTSYQALSGHEV